MSIAVKDSIAAALNQDEYVKDEILDERQDLQDYLKGRRREVMKIADKRREKVRSDVNEKAALVTRLSRLNARIRETKAEIGRTKAIIVQVDTLLANGNMQGALEIGNEDISPEDLEEAAADPEGKGAAIEEEDFFISRMQGTRGA